MSDSNGKGWSLGGHWPERAMEEAIHAGDLSGPLERLVIVLLEECVARGYERIEIKLGDEACPTYLVRGDKKLEMDTPPRILFGPLKEQVARMCGKKEPVGEGKFSALLKRAETSARPYCEVQVSAVLGESMVELTIREVRELPA